MINVITSTRFLIAILMFNSVNVSAKSNLNYSIPYSVSDGDKGMYINLRPVEKTEKSKQIISRVKIIAKKAGYPLIGPEFNQYLSKKTVYETEIHLNENCLYYVLHIIPLGLVTKSHNLEIVIEKHSGEVIRILKGG